jgi:hypothetical protein
MNVDVRTYNYEIKTFFSINLTQALYIHIVFNARFLSVNIIFYVFMY